MISGGIEVTEFVKIRLILEVKFGDDHLNGLSQLNLLQNGQLTSKTNLVRISKHFLTYRNRLLLSIDKFMFKLPIYFSSVNIAVIN